MPNRLAPQVGATRFCSATIEREAGQKSRRFKFVASDETVDRYGDIIRADGWQLDNYRKNPVLLYGHQSRELPIGRVEPIEIEGTRLVAHAEFAPEGLSDFADQVCAFCDAGILNAVSVGFLPTKAPNEIKDPDTNQWTGGYEFIAQELLELSVVPVPANPAALQLARSFSLNEQDIRRLFAPPDGERAALAARIAAEGAHRQRRINQHRLRR